MEMIMVRKKEPSKRFVNESGIVEYTEAELEAMREGITEKDFDAARYKGKCPARCQCGKGACPII